MIKLLVIADDFTGALDTGVQFSKNGISTLVTFDRNICFETIGTETEVLVIDIESRHVPPQDAYERVWQAAKTAIENGVTYFYKKTDSTLRGNIGAELTALLEACENSNHLAFIPAFPKGMRTTKNGIQYVNNVELEKTEFSDDPFSPVKQSSVVEIIRQQSDVSVVSIPVDKYEEVVKKNDDKIMFVFDAQTDDDMFRLGYALKKANYLSVLAGCAGFAEMLPELIELPRTEMRWNGNRDNILVISGSVNQIAINQMNYAKEHGYVAITLSPQQKLNKKFAQSKTCADLVETITCLLSEKKRVIVEAISTHEQLSDAEEYARVHSIPLSTCHLLVMKNIGELVKQVIEKASLGNLMVVGGDTLYGIMKKIHCDSILPVVEITPGVVAATVISKTRNIRIITKAGGFGQEDIIDIIDDFVFA